MTESDSTVKNKVLSSLFWKVLENGGTQGVNLIVQIILARLVTPGESGDITLVLVYITIANVFIQTGFSTSLIQKKSADETDFSSVFYMTLAISAVLYAIIYIAAPYIDRYNTELTELTQLTPLLRAVGIILFFGAVTSIQQAVVARSMQFKKLFMSSFAAVVFSGAIGVVLAYQGKGVWALAAQQVSYQAFLAVILIFTVKWRPRLLFSLKRLKVLFQFGWKLLCSSLLDTVYNNVYSLVIRKVYDGNTLGYYSKGDMFPQVVTNSVNGAIQSVLLPVMSSCQDDKNRLKDMVRRSIKTSCYLVFPMMIGLAAVASSLVKVILTDVWIDCVPYMRIICFSYAFWPVHIANLQAINALGRSDIYLRLEIIKKIVGAITLVISIPMGVTVMVLFKPITSVIGIFINAGPNKKLLNYSFSEQIKDILPTFIVALIMGAIVFAMEWLLSTSPIITLVSQVVVGVIVYLLLSFIFRLESFRYLLDTLKSLRKKKA